MARKKYAEKARQTVAGVVNEEKTVRENEREVADKEYKDRVERLVAGEMKRIFDNDWRKQIDKAAKDKKRETTISIASRAGNNSGLSPGELALVEVGKKFLAKEGFTVKYDSEYSPRVGSDDPYGDTTYCFLKVSW